MDPKYWKRERVTRYARRVELRRKVEQRSKKKIARGARRGIRPIMKRKETKPRGSVGECVMPKRSIDEDMSTKRRDIGSRVSNEYTIISGSRDREDEV
jgi:hypothetical protein